MFEMRRDLKILPIKRWEVAILREKRRQGQSDNNTMKLSWLPPSIIIHFENQYTLMNGCMKPKLKIFLYKHIYMYTQNTRGYLKEFSSFFNQRMCTDNHIRRYCVIYRKHKRQGSGIASEAQPSNVTLSFLFFFL